MPMQVSHPTPLYCRLLISRKFAWGEEVKCFFSLDLRSVTGTHDVHIGALLQVRHHDYVNWPKWPAFGHCKSAMSVVGLVILASDLPQGKHTLHCCEVAVLVRQASH